MSFERAQEKIRTVVASWPRVSVSSHRFGGIEFHLGNRELGHIHGDLLLDMPFPRPIRDELVESGTVKPHHILPKSGWISFFINTQSDIETAIGLLRRAYDIAESKERRGTVTGN